MKVDFILLKREILVISFFLLSIGLLAQIGIGVNPPDASAMLEMQTDDQGFLPPRLTTAERDMINLPVEGLIIYNKTVNCLQYNSGTPAAPEWKCFDTLAACTPIGNVSITQTNPGGVYSTGNTMRMMATVSPSDASYPLIYSWYRTGTLIYYTLLPGPYEVPSVSSTDTGIYVLRVSNPCSTVVPSNVLPVSVGGGCIPLTGITLSQSGTGTYAPGGSVTFSAAKTPINATTPITFEWYGAGRSLGTNTTGSYSDTNLTAPDAGAYMIRAYNSCSTILTSNMESVEVGAGTCTPITGVTLSQSGNGTYTLGGSVTFTATVAPSGSSTPVTYQWYRGDRLLATNSSTNAYTITSLTNEYAGFYTVKVSNGCTTELISNTISVTIQQTAAQRCAAIDGSYVLNARYTRPDGSEDNDLGAVATADVLSYYSTVPSGDLCVIKASATVPDPNIGYTYCEAFGPGWRLANVKEVNQMMINRSAFFDNQTQYRYWSDTTTDSGLIYLRGGGIGNAPVILVMPFSDTGGLIDVKCVKQM